MIVAATILAITACAIYAIHVLLGDAALRDRTKRRTLVTTKDGLWFAGVLLEHDRRSIVLRDVTTEAEGGPAVVDGEVLILLADVAHIQFP